MSSPIQLEPESTIVFFGDSITDCGRNRSQPSSLGNGYVALLASLLGSHLASPKLRILNRGISGNRVRDLLARARPDVIDESPSVVAILIGINDTWRRFDRNDPTTTEDFARDYHQLISLLREELPNGQILLMEPFLLPTPADRIKWREDLDPKIGITRQLAREHGCPLVPLDGHFAAASAASPMEFWLPDGVHPSAAGHGLIARALWQKFVGRSFPG